MKKIIVPVDFSEYSENALRTAAFLAKQKEAEVLAVHMLELSNAVISQSESAVQQEMVFYLKLAEKRFNEFLQKEYLSDVKVTPIIKHFKIFSELDDLAKNEEADLIIMGSKGVGGVKEILVGSNTEKVIRHAHVPVLVIKEEPIASKIEKVLFACDFSDEDVEPYMKAKKFFKNLDAKIEILYVSTPNSKFKSSKELEDRMMHFFNQTDEKHQDSIPKVKMVSDYSVEKGVFYYANKENSDILVVATHGRKGITHFFEGSISEDIANHSKLPVLSFKVQ
ncbi:universal stress protein [Tenacibaculum tangerinum]|uniref:Universal stress protein n=2 Tax=Tenacibaculum tangerinum TaxID=3038772 RepID=A0ABY8L9Z1_9FLAO|nr:universal stress protein [Tenacibaculum tangerinum]